MSPLKLCLCLLSCIFCLTTAYGTRIHYTILDRSKNKPGDKHTSEIDLQEAYRILRGATEFVLGNFAREEQRAVQEQKYNRVVLITQSFEEHHMPSHAQAVASTCRNVIMLNSDYLQRYKGDVKGEFEGILYHETTHVWQNDGNRKAPTGLLNGIADYMRMKAGFASKGWPMRGSGSRWDQGYAVTAYFLEYCDNLRPGGNFVRELNGMMKYSYSDEYFIRILGSSVYELWSNYLNSYRHDVGEPLPTIDESSSLRSRKGSTIGQEQPVNAVVLPRVSDEADEILGVLKDRRKKITKDEGEDRSGCVVEMIRGLLRVITHQVELSKEDGDEIA